MILGELTGEIGSGSGQPGSRIDSTRSQSTVDTSGRGREWTAAVERDMELSRLALPLGE